MVSTSVSLLVLCVALAAHAVNACIQLKQGYLSDMNTTFNAELAANQKSLKVYIGTHGSSQYSSVINSGVQVEVCSLSIPSAVEVSFSERHSEVRIRRLAHADFSVPLQFRIKAHYSVLLHDVILGVTDAVKILE